MPFQSLYEEVSGLIDVLSVFPPEVQTPVLNVELVDRKAKSAWVPRLRAASIAAVSDEQQYRQHSYTLAEAEIS